MAEMGGPAEAKPHRSHVRAEDPSPGDFWRDIIEPHREVVTAIVAKARTAIEKLSTADDGDEAVEQRVRRVSDAYGMLRYARKLSPDNTEVLSLLGIAADELGKTRQALEALEACVRQKGPGHTDAEVTGRLGMIYLRLGKLDDAIRWLRYARGPTAASDNAAATVYLATALAAHGEMSTAIDLLVNALPAQINYVTEPFTLVSFALAVHYDRDEQRGAAFEVLDKMQATLQQELGPFVQRALAGMRFAPPEDQYYYRALLYEALDDFTEARAEWALYASVTDAPWRRRALEHIQAIDQVIDQVIDAQRSAHPGALPTPPAGPSSGRPLLRRRPVP
jgi:tetratricopeptide (TPR) repeat protein